MRAHAIAVLFVLGLFTSISAQESAQEEKDSSTKDSFHVLAPEGTAVVLTIPSLDALKTSMNRILEKLPAEAKKEVPPLEAMLGLGLAQITGKAGLDGLDTKRPLGFALTTSNEWFLFLPVADKDALAQGIDASKLHFEKEYAVFTESPDYESGETPLQPVSSGDVVLSVLPNAWLATYEPMIDQFVQMGLGQLEQAADGDAMTGLAKILKAEVKFGLDIVRGIKQLDLTLSTSKNKLLLASHLLPAKGSFLKKVHDACQKTDIKAARDTAKWIPAGGFVEFAGIMPPEAVRAVMDVFPWDVFEDEDGSVDLTGFKKLMNSAIDLMEGHFAGSVYIDPASGNMTFYQAAKVTDGDRFRKLVRRVYTGKEFKSFVDSMKSLLPSLELSYEKDWKTVSGVTVDQLKESFVTPGAGEMTFLIGIAFADDTVLYALDTTNEEAIDSLIKAKANDQPFENMLTKFKSQKSLASGVLNLSAVLEAVKSTIPPETSHPLQRIELGEGVQIPFDVRVNPETITTRAGLPLELLLLPLMFQ